MKSIKTIKKNCQECQQEFMVAQKELNRGNGKFCSLSCSSRHTNRTNQNIRETKCRTCGHVFSSIRTNSCYCSVKCKNNYFNGKRCYSNKKVISKLPCELCGWMEAARDVHHIISVADDGTDELDNLIAVCPNDHRKIHSNLVSQEQLLAAVYRRTISSSGMVTPELDANVVIKES